MSRPKGHPLNSQISAIGGLESWARTTDRSARTAPARAAFLKQFADYPDPDAAYKAHMRRLALKSAAKRRAK